MDRNLRCQSMSIHVNLIGLALVFALVLLASVVASLERRLGLQVVFAA